MIRCVSVIHKINLLIKKFVHFRFFFMKIILYRLIICIISSGTKKKYIFIISFIALNTLRYAVINGMLVHSKPPFRAVYSPCMVVRLRESLAVSRKRVLRLGVCP